MVEELAYGTGLIVQLPTMRAVRVHLQAAGDEWWPGCQQCRKQYKAADSATVIVFGSFEKASVAGRPV